MQEVLDFTEVCCFPYAFTCGPTRTHDNSGSQTDSINTQVKAIGESREDDQRRIAIGNALTPFEKKQGVLNGHLRELKAAANKVQENKGAKDYDGCREAQAGRKAYKDAKSKIDRLMGELRNYHAEFKTNAVTELIPHSHCLEFVTAWFAQP